MSLKRIIFGTLAVTAALFTSTGGKADSTVHVMVVRENSVGSSSQAQPYVDKLVAAAAKQNGWASAKGRYITRRKTAKRYIKKKKPEFAILSLGAFLGLRKKAGMTVVGVAEISGAGGRKYHLVSKTAGDLNGCKGQTLATNHASDKKFIDRVVSGGDFDLSDFTVEKTKRPVQTLKKVIRGEAKCALIDAAQMAELSHVDGGGDVKSVWSSKVLPPMAVVSLSSASASASSKFKGSLANICAGDTKADCDKMGIKSLRASGSGPFAAAIANYGN